MKFKTVCLLGGGLTIGGQERALVFLANSLAEKGDNVFIISLFQTSIDFDLHPSITVYFPGIDRSKMNKFIYTIRMIPFIRGLIKHNKPDAVICFGDWFNAFAIVATRGLSSKMIITNRMGPNLFLGNFVETMNRIFYRFADELIVQTERAKEILKKKYKVKKITVIPNPVQFVNLERRIQKKQIITVGRLSREKGHEVLLKAIAQLRNKEWKLHLVGDGNERPSLEQLSRELKIDNKVVFHGRMQNFEQLLLESTIFVLPSFYEGFPNALLEAMSLGLCCVASDCIAGPSEIITNGFNGFLFEPGNDVQLAECLNQLIEDKQLINKLSNNAPPSLKGFEKGTIVKQFEKALYHN